MKYTLHVVFAISLVLLSCNREDVFAVTEIPLPQDSVVVTIADRQITYDLVGRSAISESGLGYRIGANGLAVVSDSLDCDGQGGFGYKFGDISSFLVAWANIDGDAPFPYFALNAYVENGDTAIAEWDLFLEGCSQAPPQLTIIEQTDSTVRGRFEAEFFRLSVVDTFYNDCRDWRSVGILGAEFSVPIIDCEG